MASLLPGGGEEPPPQAAVVQKVKNLPAMVET